MRDSNNKRGQQRRTLRSRTPLQGAAKYQDASNAEHRYDAKDHAVGIRPDDATHRLHIALDGEKLEQFEKAIGLKAQSSKGKKLRKAFERPRPDLPSDAPINRTRKPVALTLPPDLIEDVNNTAKAKGVDRTAFIEFAIRMALQLK